MSGTLEQLGELLRQKRRGIQFSQDDLEKATGINQPMISRLERGIGDFDIGIFRALRLLCAYLGISRLEAYHLAGLLDFEDEEDKDAIEVALRVLKMQKNEREALKQHLEKV